MSLAQNDAIELTVTPNPYVTVRYAGASSDFNPIHIDEEFAKNVKLPRRILHDLWTMAQVARAHTDAAGVRLGARDLGHRPQPVQDPPGQADRLGELLVDVDRVEVARGAGVAVGQEAVGRDTQLRKVLAVLQVVHAHTPRTMFVHVPVQTVSPSWRLDTLSKT